VCSSDPPFRRAKRDLHEKLKSVREHLKERDDLLGSEPNSTQTIQKSQIVRRELKEARDVANEMKEQQQKDQARKIRKLPQEELQARDEQLQLVWKHIEECERLEKRRYQPSQQQQPNTQQRTDLFAQRARVPGGPSAYAPAPAFAPATQTDLPPIEVEQFMQEFKKKDAQIDQGVEEIGRGVTRIKHMAQAIGSEIDVQTRMLDEIESKVDDTNLHLLNINRKMKKTLEKIQGGDRFIVNLVLLLIFLGIAGYIYSMVKK